jgi:hypothetical protein
MVFVVPVSSCPNCPMAEITTTGYARDLTLRKKSLTRGPPPRRAVRRETGLCSTPTASSIAPLSACCGSVLIGPEPRNCNASVGGAEHGAEQHPINGQAVSMANRRLIGYWREHADPDWPDPADFVDPEWDRVERKMVELYLRSGASSASTFEIPVELGMSTCRLCGISNGVGEQCDASYLWPSGLAHYVEAPWR